MTEPSHSFGAAAATRGLGPAGLLRWPARAPLNLAPEPVPEPTQQQEPSPALSQTEVDTSGARPSISTPSTERLPLARPATPSRPLGRPGPGVLAGSAIAGLLLVVAPIAMSALQRPEVVATVPVNAGAGLRADSGAGGTSDEQGSGGSETAGGGGSEDGAGPGYVPEPLSQGGNGGDSGSGSQDGDSGSGSQDGSSGSGSQDGSSGSEGAPAGGGDPTDSSEQGSDPDGGDGGGDGGGDPDAPEGGEGQNEPMVAGAGPSDEPSPDDGEEPGGESPSASSSALSFTALAGPGCPPGDSATYGTAGREGDAAARWATRDGGYSYDGCDGSYDAIPVSGTTEHGDGQFAYWSFSPGSADAQCDVFVYVPEDDSPRWITDREAMYQIFPGPEPSGNAEAVFGVAQAEHQGGWVKATGFVSPAEQFTVQLTNIGENALENEDSGTSHVAASAVRAECS